MPVLTDLLLVDEDLPGATPVPGQPQLDQVDSCTPVVRAENLMLSLARDDAVLREWTVGGTTYESAAFELASDESVHQVFERGLRQGNDRCLDSEPPSIVTPDVTIVLERDVLEGLPPGGVGYVGTDRGTDGSLAVRHRAYAVVGTAVVLVGARRGDAQPIEPAVPELLARLLERAGAATGA